MNNMYNTKKKRGRKACKHQNLVIYETGKYTSERSVIDGKLSDEAVHDNSDLLPELFVICHDCGNHFTFNREKTLPQWLQKYVKGYTMLHEED